MPLGVSTSFPNAYDTWPAIAPTDKFGTDGKEGNRVAAKIFAALDALERRVGKVGETDSSSHEYRLNTGGAGQAKTVVNVTEHGIHALGDVGYDSAAMNTWNFAVLVGAYDNRSADFYFPAGIYPTWGFTLTGNGQRIVGDGGVSALPISLSESNYVNGNWRVGTMFRMDTTGPCISIYGPDSSDYWTRIYGGGVVGVHVRNNSTLTNVGLRIKYATQCKFVDYSAQGFRGDGGAIYATNLADSFFYDCHFDFCGSNDGSNKAAVKFTGEPDAGQGTYWGVDEVRFINCRWEVCGDRQVHLDNVSYAVPKIRFIGCKWENSSDTNGSNDANQAQFLFEWTTAILFDDCDFTIQTRAAGFVLPTMFRLQGACLVMLSNCSYHCGSGSNPKIFTNLFVVDNGNTNLVLSNFFVDCGNSTAFPTKILSATNSPKLSQRNVGFTSTNGSGKVAADWYTAAEWIELGEGGGLIA